MEKNGYAILIHKPDGYVSHEYNLTVGKSYRVLDWMGSCVVVSADDEQSVSIHHSRFIRDDFNGSRADRENTINGMANRVETLLKQAIR